MIDFKNKILITNTGEIGGSSIQKFISLNKYFEIEKLNFLKNKILKFTNLIYPIFQKVRI